MGTIASQITSLMIVYSTDYSDADQRKRQSFASLAFVQGIHWGPVNSPHKWPVTRKMFPFDDVIMSCWWPSITRCRGARSSAATLMTILIKVQVACKGPTFMFWYCVAKLILTWIHYYTYMTYSMIWGQLGHMVRSCWEQISFPIILWCHII